MARLRLNEISGTPTSPPPGNIELYAKTDDVVYVLNSAGAEVPIGTPDAITDLTGDVTATGPGSVAATVNTVGGKTAAEIAQSVDDTQDATSLNTPSTIVKRDVSGDFSAGTITADLVGDVTGNVTGNVNGVDPANHESRHLPAGADPLTTAAPLVNLDSTTTNATGTANSLARSDHSHAISTAAAVTQTPDQANAAGTAAELAKADHIHNIPTDAPTTILDPTTTNAEGTGTSFARNDHTHAIATSLVGDITTIQPDDSASAGTVDKYARGDHKHAIVTAIVSTQTPDQSNAEGSSTSFSRADHIHNIPSGSVLQIGTSNSSGSTASFALSDHIHAHGAQTNTTLHALATTSAHGFMSSTDKTKLDNSTDLNTPSTLVQRDSSGNFAAGTITANLTGTASNNVIRAGDTMTGAFMIATVALTDAATITTDASLGNMFTVTIAGNRTLAAPTNPTNGQKIVYRITQDATGNRGLTFNAIFNFGSIVTAFTPTTTANKTDYIGCIYNSSTVKWDVVAISKGF